MFNRDLRGAQSCTVFSGLVYRMSLLKCVVSSGVLICRTRVRSHAASLTLSSRALSTTGSMQGLDISGIYPPIATPFNSDESIAYDKLQANMDIWNKIPFRGKWSNVTAVLDKCTL